MISASVSFAPLSRPLEGLNALLPIIVLDFLSGCPFYLRHAAGCGETISLNPVQPTGEAENDPKENPLAVAGGNAGLFGGRHDR
jgi:hypothetical protein